MGPKLEVNMTESNGPSPSLYDLLNSTERGTIDPNAVNDLTPEEAQEVRGVVEEVAQNPSALSDTSILKGFTSQMIQALTQQLLQNEDPNTMTVPPDERKASPNIPPWWMLDPALVTLIQQNPDLVNLINQNPDLINAIQQNPDLIDAFQQNPDLVDAFQQNPDLVDVVNNTPVVIDVMANNPAFTTAVNNNPPLVPAMIDNPRIIHTMKNDPVAVNKLADNPALVAQYAVVNNNIVNTNILQSGQEGAAMATVDPDLLDPAAPGPTIDPALLDPAAPGPTIDPNALDPNAPGPTVDPSTLDPGPPEPGVVPESDAPDQDFDDTLNP